MLAPPIGSAPPPTGNPGSAPDNDKKKSVSGQKVLAHLGSDMH